MLPIFWFVTHINGLFVCVFKSIADVHSEWAYKHRAGDISIIWYPRRVTINFEGGHGDGILYEKRRRSCLNWSKERAIHEFKYHLRDYVYPYGAETYLTLKRRASFSAGDRSHAHPRGPPT